MDTFNVLGLNTEDYEQEYLVGGNCDFKVKLRPGIRFYIYIEHVDTEKKFSVMLDTDYSKECGSGWTTASYGIMKIQEILEVPKLRYIPLDETVRHLTILPHKKYKNYECELFYFSKDGDDEYYPCGGIGVSMDKFKERKFLNTKSAKGVP